MIENTGGSGTLTIPTSSLPTKGGPPKEFKNKNFPAPNFSTPTYSYSSIASSTGGGNLVTELFTDMFSAVQDIVKILLPNLKGNNVNSDSDIFNNDNLSNDWDVPGKIAKGEKNLPSNSLK